MTKNNCPRKAKQIKDKKKEDLQNCSKLAIFSLFQISNPNVFVIFGFPSKTFCFYLRIYFCFPQKIYRLVSPIQPKLWTSLQGERGVKKRRFLTPQTWKVRFHQHCHKTTPIKRFECGANCILTKQFHHLSKLKKPEKYVQHFWFFFTSFLQVFQLWELMNVFWISN